MKRLLPGLAILVCLAACSDDTTNPGSRFAAFDTVELAVDTTGRAFINVIGNNGNINVTGVPGAAMIRVRAVIRVEADSQEEADIGLSDVSVEVDTIAPDPDIVKFITQQSSVDAAGRYSSVDYEVTMPAEWGVYVRGYGNGDSHVSSFTAEAFHVYIELNDGDARATDILTATWIGVQRGNISANVELARSQFINLIAEKGSIDLRIPRWTSAMLTADGPRDDLHIRNLDIVEYVEKRKGHVVAQLGDGRSPIDVYGLNGPVRVTGYETP